MVQRAQKKLFLDTMVNRGSTKTGEEMDKLDTKEMLKMLSFGMNAMFAPKSSSKDDETTFSFTDAQIDRLIDRKQTVSNFKTFGREDDEEDEEKNEEVTLEEQRVNLEQFNENEGLVSMTTFEGEEYRDKDSDEKKRRRRFETINKDAIQTTKRKRTKRVVMVDGFEILKSNMYVIGRDGLSGTDRRCSSAKRENFNQITFLFYHEIIDSITRAPTLKYIFDHSRISTLEHQRSNTQTQHQHTQQVQLGGRRTVRHGKRIEIEQTKDVISCVCSSLKT